MKHDWPRYANGDPKPERGRDNTWLCRRCGIMFAGFVFEDADRDECPQPELDGFPETLTPE